MLMLEDARGNGNSHLKGKLVSIGLHVAAIALMLFPFATQIPLRFPPPGPWIVGPERFVQPPLDFLRRIGGGEPSGGGNNDLGPARRGQMRVSPRSVSNNFNVVNLTPALPITPAVMGREEAVLLPEINRWGNPLASELTPWLGRGKNGGVGEGKRGGVGDREGIGVDGEGGGLPAGSAQPTCDYCPTPRFTDDAIKAKYQGRVLLRVHVGADGRVRRIAAATALGMGLEERAIETVRTWRFRPARGPNGQALATTVLVEVYFRQF